MTRPVSRRDVLRGLGAASLLALMPALARAGAEPRYGRLLVLVELKGGNDGLNTVVPFGDAEYYALRPRLALRAEDCLPLADGVGLHPSLAALMPTWHAGELAILQGVGYPKPNLSHFRSIEIWDTASASDQYLQQGWLARSFLDKPPPPAFAAHGLVIGSQGMGPLLGGARVVALTNPEQFSRLARLAGEGGTAAVGALAHIRRVEADIRQAADRLGPASLQAARRLTTEFPASGLGAAARTACQTLASGADVAVLHLSLAGFDTHQNQSGTHANLLRQLAEGLSALRSGLTELGLWDRSLVLTYSEFGRRARENQSGGTDHGTAAVHFALGGSVRGGILGEAPSLRRLDADGNLVHGLDFRRIYATVLERWWGLDSQGILGGRFAPLGFVG